MATRLDVEIAQADIGCRAAEATFQMQMTRWQSVQNAALASLALTYTGLFTRVLDRPTFVLLAGLGAFFVLIAVKLQEQAHRRFQGELARIRHQLARLKER